MRVEQHWKESLLSRKLKTIGLIPKAICVNYSQGIEVFFGENAGICTAVIYRHAEDFNFWNSSTLNTILTI